MSETIFKDVFISYGRKQSLAFATKLFESLEGSGHTTWFDFMNIPKGDDFQKRIDDGIRSAHNFIFIISPHANVSAFCLKEIEMALSLGKRIIPILHIKRDLEKIHPEIGVRNWIYAREKEDETIPLVEWEAIDDFEKAFAEIITLLHKEKEYVETHTELLWNALKWESRQKQTQYLLVGKERQEAEEWLLTEFTPPKQPPCKPTDLHCQYICEARKNAENLMTAVFICNDDADRVIRNQVVQSLARHVITTWTYDQDLVQGEQYEKAIEAGIEQADNFLFFISPESLQSEACKREIHYAQKLNKRILPLIVREVEKESVQEFGLEGLEEDRLQYTHFIDNKNQDDYNADIDHILNLLKKDQAYYEQHKILLARATQWEQESQKSTFLLRGYNLENAATWLQLNEKRTQHAPTDLHKKLIQASQAAKGSLSTEVFISYSRKDADFARNLNRRLQEAGKTTWFDQESISSGVDFEKEIFKGIDGSDNIVFILSPDSVESEYCEREVLYAINKNKRFVTVLHRETQPETMPEALRVINWIDFTNIDSRTFDKAFSSLIQAIELDQAHAHQHTILQQRATEWKENLKNPDFLLNISACQNAEKWLHIAETPNRDGKQKQPTPTPLQKEFIITSRTAIDLSEQQERKRREELKTALNTAEKQKKYAQANLAKANKLINAFYFYDDKYALAYGKVAYQKKFYFIDKNGDRVEALTKNGWDNAEQFDNTGFSKVWRKRKAYLLDTEGNAYAVTYSLGEMTEQITALDLSNRYEEFPLQVFNFPQLKALFVNGKYGSKNKFEEIPPEIKKLTQLKILHLSFGELASLPPEIGMLRNLTKLDLSINQISSLPSEIGDLPRLTELNLKRNQLTALPPEIGNLEQLTKLVLSSNYRLTELPAEIGNLKNLTELQLSGNYELKELPAVIGSLKKLRKLIFSGIKQLTELSPKIGRLVNLLELDLSSNQLTTLPSKIKQLEKLKKLDLSSNQLTNLPTEIKDLGNLTELILKRNALKSIPAELGKLENLMELDLSNNQLTILPSEIGDLEYLAELDLSDNQLKELPLEIGKLENLTELDVVNNQLTELPTGLWKLENLTKLKLSNNNIRVLPPELGNLENLIELSLMDIQLTELPAEIGKLKNLEILILGFDDSDTLYDVDEDKINKLTTLPPEIGQLQQLKTLELYNNPIPKEMREEIQALLPNCKIGW